MAKQHAIEAAISNMEATLLGITVGAGYELTVAGVERASTLPDAFTDKVVYLVLEPDIEVPEVQYQGLIDFTATVNCYMGRTVTGDFEAALLYAAGAMHKALMADRTRGNTAQDTVIAAMNISAADNPRYAQLTVRLRVRTSFSDPLITVA